ncbi:methyltransferase domain-containing protein [Billgrantia antri]|uniref:Methyltransferase domain-containing protein n=1 Tax=Halomonas sulfidivorans TaxID=2733488 RepID=A0ABX7WFR8_9GAMM|nr:class I SAM-dependent methyltransferase [Halomonas sulfidivorans]QTP58886.1 methyltransferase domain-containing protein [Halomonas sulfidivorans]
MNEAKKGFYKALEDEFRGERDEIKSRLEVYLPFINILKKIHPDAKALDLGCGRGEWLELLRDNGFSVQGVDLDEDMLAACRERGFQVEIADAIDFLSGMNNESASVISAFHVVEHISFDKLQTLVEESLRVLQPGGLLILETPNSENIMVGISSFYLDPTHHRPIPSQLLSFLPDYYGFYRSKILRLQESFELSKNHSPTLSQVLVGSSPDYSVIAQKKSDAEAIAMFDSLFNIEYGISSYTLAAHYDEYIHNKIHHLENEILKIGVDAEKAREAGEELRLIYSSRSWRVTAPLRWVALQLRLLRAKGGNNRIKSLFKKVLIAGLKKIILFINERPLFRSSVLFFTKKLGLEQLLRRMYKVGRVSQFSNSSATENAFNSFEQLTPGGKEIYFELKSLIEQKKRHG